MSRDRAPRGRRFLGPCGSKCACTVFRKRSYVAGPFAVTSGPCALTSVCIVRGWGQLAWAGLSGAGRGLAVTSSRKPGGRCRCSELDATPREGARGARPRSWAAELPGGGEEGRDARSVESATVQRGIGVACAASSARPCSLLHIVHTTPCCCRSPSRRVQDGSSNRNGCQALGGRRAPRPRVPLACPSWGWRGVCFSLPCLPGLGHRTRPRALWLVLAGNGGAWRPAAGGVDPATVPALPSWPDGYTLVAESMLVGLSRVPSPRDPGLALR